jgi:hypothetical protein
MSYPSKPGDTFTAKVIGTWPELPDSPFDTKADDPKWYCEHDFPGDGSHVMRYGGPKGEVVVTLADGVFVHARPDGEVLRRSVWDHLTMTWKVTEETT